MIRPAALTALLVISLAAAACAGPAAEPAPGDAVFALGEPFWIAVDQTAALNDGSLRLTFADVTEDSRCALDVQCIWSGQVTVRLEVETGEQLSDVNLTLPTPGLAVDEIGGYRFELLEVEPYPERAGEAIPRSAYRASLLVTMAGPDGAPATALTPLTLTAAGPTLSPTSPPSATPADSTLTASPTRTAHTPTQPPLTAAPATQAPSSFAFRLGEVFRLPIDQTAALADGSLRLTFLDVTEDSRCPLDVQCIWAGQVTIRLLATLSNVAGETSLTFPDTGQGTSRAALFSLYTVELRGVEPYPRQASQPIQRSQYQADLIVTSGVGDAAAMPVTFAPSPTSAP